MLAQPNQQIAADSMHAPQGVSHAVHFKPKNLPTVRTLRTSQPNVSGVL